MATVEDSVLSTEMGALESQEEDAPKRVLWYKPMAFWWMISPHHRDESWSTSLCQSFLTTCVGVNIPALTEMSLSDCGCRKFNCDVLDDHVNTCTSHSGTKKAHDWSVE